MSSVSARPSRSPHAAPAAGATRLSSDSASYSSDALAADALHECRSPKFSCAFGIYDVVDAFLHHTVSTELQSHPSGSPSSPLASRLLPLAHSGRKVCATRADPRRALTPHGSYIGSALLLSLGKHVQRSSIGPRSLATEVLAQRRQCHAARASTGVRQFTLSNTAQKYIARAPNASPAQYAKAIVHPL